MNQAQITELAQWLWFHVHRLPRLLTVAACKQHPDYIPTVPLVGTISALRKRAKPKTSGEHQRFAVSTEHPNLIEGKIVIIKWLDNWFWLAVPVSALKCIGSDL